MNEQVVCLVRGGEAGRATQEEAIQYARKTEKKLVFLHIINPSGYQAENESLQESVLKEQSWLARVNLSQARQRAERRGSKAEVAIQLGPFVETVQAYLTGHPVNRIYIGKPRQDRDDFVERLEHVQGLADLLTSSTGVEVIIV